MAQHKKNVGIIASYNKEKAKSVIPTDPSPAITNRLDRYDVGSETWTRLTGMSSARAGFGMYTDDDFLYVVGGTNGSTIHKTVEEYDINSDTWSYKAPMTTARCFFASCVADDFIYCIGGLTVNAFGITSVTRKVEKYDIFNDEWTELAELPVGYAVAMGIAYENSGTIHVLSGTKNGLTDVLNAVLTYDITGDSWTTNVLTDELELSLYQRLLPFSFKRGTDIYVMDGLYYNLPKATFDIDGNKVSEEPPIIQYLPDVYKYSTVDSSILRGERDFQDIPLSRFDGVSAAVGTTNYFIGGINPDSNTLRFMEIIDSSFAPYLYDGDARLQRGRSSLGAVGYSGDYGSYVYVAGGVISKQGENFLRVEIESVPNKVRLDGKMSANVRVNVFDENLEAPSEVKVRLVGKGGEDDLILFTSDEIIAKDGYALATLIPRSDDAFDSITMDDEIERSYPVTISGAIIDGLYYGDTNPATDVQKGNISIIGNEEDKIAQVNLPDDFHPVIEFDTVISAEQTTPGSFFASSLASLGGYLSLLPNINGGGKDTIVDFFSDISWLPQITALIESNEGTYNEARDYLDRISRELPFGGSPIMDAIARSAEIMEFDVTGVRKAVYVMTDGQENCSHYSTKDALKSINNTGGIGKTPIISSQFRVVPDALYIDQGIRQGSTDLEFLARETNASTLYVASDEDVGESIKSLLKARGFVGAGVFTFEFDLGDEYLIQSVVANFDIPDAETTATWRYSIGNNDRRFSLLTDKLAANEVITISEIHGRYFKFVAEFSATLDANEYDPDVIVPPMLTSVEITYHKKREAYIYLNPHESTEDPQQVVVSFDMTRPPGSEVLIGMYDHITGTWEDYSSPASPAVENNSRIVVPLRRSLDASTLTLEKLTSIDNFVFETTYGKWSNDAVVKVLRDGEEEVPESEYSTIPHKGRVVFAYRTEDNYVISIENKKTLSVAAKVVNRVNGKPIQITGAGYMYSTVQPQRFSAKDTTVPEASNLLITPLQPDRDSVFRANYTYVDLRGREEKTPEKGGTLITWIINDKDALDVKNLREWDNKDYSLVSPGDVVYFVIEPGTDNDGALLLGHKVRSLPVTVG